MDTLTSASSETKSAGGNKLLTGLLAFFILIIIFEGGYYFFFKKGKSPENTIGPKPSIINPTWPDTQTNSDTPPGIKDSFNYNEFMLLKQQVPKDAGKEIPDGSVFKGKVISVIPPRDGGPAAIKLESQLPGSEGKLAWYVYPDSVVSKISIRNMGDENTSLTFADIKPGDNVTMEEQFNLGQDYPDSLVFVKITR